MSPEAKQPLPSLEEALRPKPFVIVGEMSADQANKLAYPGDHAEAIQEQEALAREVGGAALGNIVEGQTAFAIVVKEDGKGNQIASHYVVLNGDIGTTVLPRKGEEKEKMPGYFELNNMPEPSVALESLRHKAVEKGQTALNLHRQTLGGVADRVRSGYPDDASRFARGRLENAVPAMRKAKDFESAHAMATEVALLMGAVANPNLTRDAFSNEIAPIITDPEAKEAVHNALETTLRAVDSEDSQSIRRAIEEFGRVAYDLGSKTETPKDQVETVWAMAVGMAARYQPSMLEGDLLTRFEKSVRESRK